MSALDAIDAVWTRLKTVDGVGPNVYNMVRESVTTAAFNEIFVDSTDPANKIIKAWRVTRSATSAQDKSMGAMSRSHTIEISGFMSYQDNVTEPVFQEIVENVCAAFDSYADGSARRRFVDDAHPQGRFDWSGPMQVLSIRLGMLGDKLVHAVLMQYQVVEYPL
jgi:hypothetical protein